MYSNFLSSFREVEPSEPSLYKSQMNLMPKEIQPQLEIPRPEPLQKPPEPTKPWTSEVDLDQSSPDLLASD